MSTSMHGVLQGAQHSRAAASCRSAVPLEVTMLLHDLRSGFTQLFEGFVFLISVLVKSSFSQGYLLKFRSGDISHIKSLCHHHSSFSTRLGWISHHGMGTWIAVRSERKVCFRRNYFWFMVIRAACPERVVWFRWVILYKDLLRSL